MVLQGSYLTSNFLTLKQNLLSYVYLIKKQLSGVPKLKSPQLEGADTPGLTSSPTEYHYCRHRALNKDSLSEQAKEKEPGERDEFGIKKTETA